MRDTEWDASENDNAEVVHSVGAVEKESLADAPQYIEVRPDGEDVPSPDQWDEYDMERVADPLSAEADAVYREDTTVRPLRARYYENGGRGEADLYTVGLDRPTPERSVEHLARRYGGNVPSGRLGAVVTLCVLVLLLALAARSRTARRD